VPLTPSERLQVARFSRFEIGEPEEQWNSVKQCVPESLRTVISAS
jgi:hypothetical protein